MDINDVIESLAAKLDAADLTDTEIDLLSTLIAEPDDDVAGFTIGWSPVLTAGATTKGLTGPNKLVGDDGGFGATNKLVGDDGGLRANYVDMTHWL